MVLALMMCCVRHLDFDDIIALLQNAELLLHIAWLLGDLQLIFQVGVPAMVHDAVHTYHTA